MSAANEIIGMTMLLFASFSISASTVLVKTSFVYMGVFDIMFWQALGQSILATLGCAILSINPLKHYLLKQLLGGLLGAGTFIFGFYGAVNMELSDGTILKFAAPLLTMLLAMFYLKEKVTWFRKIGMLLGFAGVLLTARPQFIFGDPTKGASGHDYPDRNWAILAILLSSVCLACSTIIIKEIAFDVHYFSLMFYLSIWYFALAAPLKLYFSSTLNTTGMVSIGFLTFGFFLGQVFGFYGIASVPASVTTLIKNMDSFFGVVFGIIFFNEALEWTTIVGCLLVFLVTICLVIENYVIAKSNAEPRDSESTIQEMQE